MNSVSQNLTKNLLKKISLSSDKAIEATKIKDFAEISADLADMLFGEEDRVSGDAKNDDKSVQVKRTAFRHKARRVLSELALEQELPWHFEPDVTYHCISFGDVDSLTYMRVIVKQQKIKYALLSTWCMAMEDINEIQAWLENGYIDRIDFYIGEIFKSSYLLQYNALIALCKKYGGRVCMFRNHSKIMVLLGEKFDAVIESSANVNTNPRTEQTCITLNSELALWYKDFFDSVKSFERHFDEVKPWQPES